VNHFCISQQGLGGDATPVQAGAAKVFLLNKRRFQTKLTRSYSRHVTAGAAPDDDAIKIFHSFHILFRQYKVVYPKVRELQQKKGGEEFPALSSKKRPHLGPPWKRNESEFIVR